MRPALAVARRLGGLVVVFLGVTFLIYAMTFALPGDPIKALGGARPLTDAVVRALRAEYHLDQPLPIGTKVNLKFTVIMDDIETIEGVGEVVRVQQDPPGMGVVFRELSQYSQHLIERLLTPQS